jgi:hypothetical protein
MMPKRTLCLLGVLFAVGIVWLLGFNRRHREENRQKFVLKQGQILGIALLMYADNHDQRLPPVANWEAELRPYLPDKSFSFLLPASADGKPRRWVLERTVAGHSWADLREPMWERVVFFEAEAAQSSPTDTLALASKNGGDEGFVVVYENRLAEYIPASRSAIFLLQNAHPLATP